MMDETGVDYQPSNEHADSSEWGVLARELLMLATRNAEKVIILGAVLMGPDWAEQVKGLAGQNTKEVLFMLAALGKAYAGAIESGREGETRQEVMKRLARNTAELVALGAFMVIPPEWYGQAFRDVTQSVSEFPQYAKGKWESFKDIFTTDQAPTPKVPDVPEVVTQVPTTVPEALPTVTPEVFEPVIKPVPSPEGPNIFEQLWDSQGVRYTIYAALTGSGAYLANRFVRPPVGRVLNRASEIAQDSAYYGKQVATDALQQVKDYDYPGIPGRMLKVPGKVGGAASRLVGRGAMGAVSLGYRAAKGAVVGGFGLGARGVGWAAESGVDVVKWAGVQASVRAIDLIAQALGPSGLQKAGEQLNKRYLEKTEPDEEESLQDS